MNPPRARQSEPDLRNGRKPVLSRSSPSKPAVAKRSCHTKATKRPWSNSETVRDIPARIRIACPQGKGNSDPDMSGKARTPSLPEQARRTRDPPTSAVSSVVREFETTGALI